MACPERFASIAEIVCRRKQDYDRLVVVISAMGDSTDELIELAHKVHPQPPQREMDMLISVGERISISLLAMALDRQGCQAVSFTGSQSGIITTSDHSNARIIDVRPYRLEDCLDKGQVVIVAGFQGVSVEREITTLGRGGSDTSAVALAVALGASEVEFYKDVPGIFDKDPKVYPEAHRYSSLSYEDARSIAEAGAQIMHARCIALAQANGIRLRVLPFDNVEGGTLIGAGGKKTAQAVYEEATITKKALVSKTPCLL